jgi:hypothetical protein
MTQEKNATRETGEGTRREMDEESCARQGKEAMRGRWRKPSMKQEKNAQEKNAGAPGGEKSDA